MVSSRSSSHSLHLAFRLPLLTEQLGIKRVVSTVAQVLYHVGRERNESICFSTAIPLVISSSCSIEINLPIRALTSRF